MLAAFLVPLLCGLARPQMSEAAFAQRTAERFVESGVPGAALAVFRDGQCIYRQVAGFSDVDRRTPYTPETAFEIGSLSKQFTATAILMLVAEGKLALEAPIGSLLPDLPE